MVNSRRSRLAAAEAVGPAGSFGIVSEIIHSISPTHPTKTAVNAKRHMKRIAGGLYETPARLSHSLSPCLCGRPRTCQPCKSQAATEILTGRGRVRDGPRHVERSCSAISVTMRTLPAQNFVCSEKQSRGTSKYMCSA